MRNVVWVTSAFVLLAAGAMAYASRLPLGAWERVVRASVDEAYACPDRPARSYPDGSYDGPLIDAHVHVPLVIERPDGLARARREIGPDDRPTLGANASIGRMACLLKAEGTMRAFAFYSVWPDMPEPMVEVARRATEAFPDAFVPFIMPPNHDDNSSGFPTVDAATLGDMLGLSPGLFRGYGEIGLYAREGGTPELPPDDPLMLANYDVARKEGMAVYLHPGVGHEDGLARALVAYPDVSFFFHGDQFVTYREDGTQDLSRIDALLDAHVNLHYGVDELYGDDFLLRPEVDKPTFLAHFDDPEPLLAEDVATWKAFIERHPDQVVWGTDRGWSSGWSLDEDVGLVLTGYARQFIERLDPSVRERFAYQNALRIWEDGQAR